MKYLSSLLLSTLCFGASAAEREFFDDRAWIDRSAALNGKTILFRVPDEFNKNPNPEVLDYLRSTLGVGNRLNAAFWTENPDRYVLIQTMDKLLKVPVSPQVKRKMAESIREGIREARGGQNNTSKEVQEEINKRLRVMRPEGGPLKDMEVEMLRPSFLEVFDETEVSFSFMILLGYKTGLGGASDVNVVVGSSTYLGIKNEWVLINIYEPYHGEASYSKVKNLTKEVVRRTVLANESTGKSSVH